MKVFVIKKEWIGKRKIDVYFLWRNYYYSFCWLQLMTDGSFSFGFRSNQLFFTEWGSSVVRSGFFTEHIQTLTSGNVDIKDALAPHVTFHSPRISQKKGIVHFVGKNGKVDEWELDWFPVKTAQKLLCTYTNISTLERITKLAGRHEIVKIPSNVLCVRMELSVHPLSSTQRQLEDRKAITNILGVSPSYIISCWFYETPQVETHLFMATDKYSATN